jgi:hypothetical protein
MSADIVAKGFCGRSAQHLIRRGAQQRNIEAPRSHF